MVSFSGVTFSQKQRRIDLRSEITQKTLQINRNKSDTRTSVTKTLIKVKGFVETYVLLIAVVIYV